MSMVNNTTYKLKSYNMKAYKHLETICSQITQNKDKKLHENAKEFYLKLINSIDDNSLQFFLTILSEYDSKQINLLQTYQN